MSTRTLAAALAVSCQLTIVPAFAQTKAPANTMQPKSTADCQANWRKADSNGDGRLDAAEKEAAKEIVPIALATSASISQQQFLSACQASIAGKK